jgi:hypothetical protein
VHQMEFRKIAEAVDHYRKAEAAIESLEKRIRDIDDKTGVHLQIGFVGWSGSIDIPHESQQRLRDWLKEEFRRGISECRPEGTKSTKN